jgi:hypothetical protein
MIKLKDLLSEAFADSHPKNKFVSLSQQDLAEFAEDIIDIITKAYKDKGGNLEFKDAQSLKSSDLTYWVANDIDEDPNIDIAIGGKKTSYGTKVTVIGQDGSKESRKEAVLKIIKLMKTRGFYAELDLDLAQKFGLDYIKDEAQIRKILNKEIKYNADGTYDRPIQGEVHTKVLVGIPKV